MRIHDGYYSSTIVVNSKERVMINESSLLINSGAMIVVNDEVDNSI